MSHLFVVCNDLRVRNGGPGLNLTVASVAVCRACARAKLSWNVYLFVLPRFVPSIILRTRAIIRLARDVALTLSGILRLAGGLALSGILPLS